jgi:hypothetical protein
MAYSPFNQKVSIKFGASDGEGRRLEDVYINNLATALDMEVKTFSSQVTIGTYTHTKYLAFKGTSDGFVLSFISRSSDFYTYKISVVKNEQVCSSGYNSYYYADCYLKAINLNEKTKILYYDGSTTPSYYYWLYIITYYYDEESQTEKMLTLCSSPSNASNDSYMRVYIDNEFIGNLQINYNDLVLDKTLYGENYCAIMPLKLDHLNCPYDKLYLVTNRAGFKYGTVFSLNNKKFVIISGTWRADSYDSSCPMKLAISCD